MQLLHEVVYKFAILTGRTTRSLCLSRPVADTAEFVKPKSGWAGVFLGGALHTSVENVAYVGIGVSVEPIQPRTKIIGTLGGLKLKTVTAIDIEIVITWFSLVAKWIKN